MTALRCAVAPCDGTLGKEPKLRIAVVSLVLLAASGVPACSSQQAYAAGQAWQRSECSKISDSQDRSRCLAAASTSYEDYRRQVEAGKKVE